MAGGFQEALTDSFTGHLRDLGGRDAGGKLPKTADTGTLRGAVKRLRDAERAPRDAPKARDICCTLLAREPTSYTYSMD